LLLDSSKEYAAGQEINANHLRSVLSGELTGIAKIVHRGRTSQVWEIKIHDEQEKLSCISRLTMAIIPAF
jgi:1,4-dihydroxy-2-naphthoyl-CoA hydrolase